jgi:probable HAF family extracellular repeat protein
VHRLLLSVAVVGVVLFAAGTVGGFARLPASSCPRGTTPAAVAGGRACLRDGGSCVRRDDRWYRRYGFACAAGKLVRPWVIRDLGELDRQLANAEINERGQIVGSVYSAAAPEPDQFKNHRPFLWQNGVLTRLTPFGGQATALNDSGQIVGWMYTAAGMVHAFLWERGTLTDLGTLGGDSSRAFALNADGEIVGESQTATGDTHAVLWDKGTITDLGTLGGKSSSAAAINDHGQIVGSSETAAGGQDAFVWQAGVMIRLQVGGYGVGDFAYAADNNNGGQVTGWTWSDNGGRGVAFLWENGTLTRIEPWERSSDPASCWAAAINADGQIIGRTDTLYRRDDTAGFSWQSGHMRLVGLGGNSSAAALNDHRDVVGGSYTATLDRFDAFVTEPGVGATDLDASSADTSSAYAINESRQIVGESKRANGRWHLVSWTPRHA